MFKQGSGNWTKYRDLPGTHIEVDFHYSDDGPRECSYQEAMGEVYDVALSNIREAYENGMEHVIFIHGWSTSRRGNTTARSIVRRLMRSKESTPYIIKAHSIQHETVFVAAIRPNPEGAKKYQEKCAERNKECARQIKFFRMQLLDLVDKSADEILRVNTRKYIERLTEDETDMCYVLDKIKRTLGNYRDQYNRRVGVFSRLRDEKR